MEKEKSVLDVVKDKEKTIRMIVDNVIGSSKHEGLEDPYGFYWEILYYLTKEEITDSEYHRLHEEYWMAKCRMKGKEATPIIKKNAEAPLMTPRSKELFNKWFINGLINTKSKSLYMEHIKNR